MKSRVEGFDSEFTFLIASGPDPVQANDRKKSVNPECKESGTDRIKSNHM